MIIALFAIGACAVASYKFLKRATGYERLVINTASLTVIGGSIFGTVTEQIALNRIVKIRHLEKPTLSDHPLKGGSFDYLGFQTEQKVISEMYGDKMVVVDHTEGQVLFGLDIYSWEFEEIIAIINEVREEVKEMS